MYPLLRGNTVAEWYDQYDTIYMKLKNMPHTVYGYMCMKLKQESKNRKDSLSPRIVVTSEEAVEQDGGGLQSKFQL